MVTVDIDNDTEVAALNLWQSDTVNLPSLFPSPPHIGRLKQTLPTTTGPQVGPLTKPYARITSAFESREKVSTAGVWQDTRKVTIDVYGLRADVVQALGYVKALFNDRLGTFGAPTLTYPSTDPVSGIPRFYRYWPEDGGEDELAPEVAQGKDIWKGTITGLVTSTRTE